MKIGIYGGTFNPPHKGHTSLAKSLVRQNLVDEVWLLVSPLNPFKQAQTSEFAPYEDRYQMTDVAVSRIKGLKASDFENHLPLPSYMINTLNALSAAYPEHEFVLVIGADNWQRFDNWYKSDEILSRYPILIYNRPGYEITLDEKPAPDSDSSSAAHPHDVKIVDTPLYDISSTQLREQIRQGKKPLKWLFAKVIEYIEQHELYR